LTRAIALAVLAGGIALAIFGYDASQSFGSEVTRVFTGNPSDRSMAMMIGGAVMIVGGAAGAFMAGKKR
jgi:uncharacterized membrane protein YidH (DUF202 family)